MSPASSFRQFPLAVARWLRTHWVLWRCRRFVKAGKGIHIGANVRLWAPDGISIGANTYIGKDTHIECNADIGRNTLIANRVAFVGKTDHDYRQLAVPVRFSRWIGDRDPDDPARRQKVTVDEDVWIGYGAILLSGICIGRGAIVAAGAVVTADVEPYAIAAGNPARTVGHRFSEEQITEHERSTSHAEYRHSYFSGWSGPSDRNSG